MIVLQLLVIGSAIGLLAAGLIWFAIVPLMTRVMRIVDDPPEVR